MNIKKLKITGFRLYHEGERESVDNNDELPFADDTYVVDYTKGKERNKIYIFAMNKRKPTIERLGYCTTDNQLVGHIGNDDLEGFLTLEELKCVCEKLLNNKDFCVTLLKPTSVQILMRDLALL